MTQRVDEYGRSQRLWRGDDGYVYIRTHVPDKAEFDTRWRVYDIDNGERFEPQVGSDVESMVDRVYKSLNVEIEREKIDKWGDEYLDTLPLTRFVFMLVHPLVPVVRREGIELSGSELVFSKYHFKGIKLAMITSLTMRFRASHHACAELKLHPIISVICKPSYEGLKFYEGVGRQILKVFSGEEYTVCEGEGRIECDVPEQVREQTRAYYYSMTKKVSFAKAEEYDSNMAAYFAQKWAPHAAQLKCILDQIPTGRRCVFPADGVGLGARLRPGSVSGDRVLHWLSHEDVIKEEIIDTLYRSRPEDVIIVMYAAVFFGPQERTWLANAKNPVIFVDAHYYPMPIMGVRIVDQHVWSYRCPEIRGPVPTDEVTIESTPVYSDKLLFLGEVIDVQEWTKTIAWYALSQRGRVTSSIPWMRDFLKAMKLNVCNDPGIPAVMSIEKGKAFERYYFIPTGQISPEPIVLGEKIDYELNVGELYRVPENLLPAFKTKEGDLVWSAFTEEFEWRNRTNEVHQTVQVRFVHADMGRVIVRTELLLQVSYQGNVSEFHRDSPNLFKSRAGQLYPKGIPSSFVRFFTEWYGGIPASLFVKKKVKRRR